MSVPTIDFEGVGSLVGFMLAKLAELLTSERLPADTRKRSGPVAGGATTRSYFLDDQAAFAILYMTASKARAVALHWGDRSFVTLAFLAAFFGACFLVIDQGFVVQHGQGLVALHSVKQTFDNQL